VSPCCFCGVATRAQTRPVVCETCQDLIDHRDAHGLAERALGRFGILQEQTGLAGPELLARLRRMIAEAVPDQ